MRESVLKAFATKGFLPPKEVAHWRAPGREDFLQPRSSEVVSFLAFHERGLEYLAHWFLRGLLNEWGLELQLRMKTVWKYPVPNRIVFYI